MPITHASSQPPAQASAAALSNTQTVGSVAQVPQVPLHRLETPGSEDQKYQTELSNDALGIVSQYLSQIDQLTMREISDSVRAVVDRTVTSLTMSGTIASLLFTQPNTMENLRELRLRDSDDTVLGLVAEALRSVPPRTLSKLELILDRADGTEVSGAGLAALAPFTFSGISLKGMTVMSADAVALSRGGSPVSISLPDDGPAWSDVASICLIPTLKLLHAPLHQLSAQIVAALQLHPALTHLSVGSLSGAAVSELTHSASIQLLSVKNMVDCEAQAFAALANSRVLRSVAIGPVNHAQSLATLSGNRLLSAITLGLSATARDGIPQLANMPALKALSLSALQIGGSLRAADVQAVCARTFESLQLNQWEIDAAGMALIVATQAHNLSLDKCYPFTNAAIEGLAANGSISSLSLQGGMINATDALRLANSPTLEYLRAEFVGDKPDASEWHIKTAWTGAHRPLANLDVTSLDLHDEDDLMQDE